MSCHHSLGSCSRLLLLLALLIPLTLFSQTKSTKPVELARQAEIVAVGTVTSVVSEWNENHSSIRTRVDLAVSEFLKGSNADKSLSLVIPGGEVDGVGELYSHMPRFQANEEVFVFARKDTRGIYRVAGGSEGKYSLQRDGVTGKLSVAGDKPLDELRSSIKEALQDPNLK